ncbi:hypothetical protein GCM10027285_19840 [Oleiagrimonas citrea]
MATVAQAADSHLVKPDLRLDPVFIDASYEMGPCSQIRSTGLLDHLLGTDKGPNDNAKKMPAYILCRQLPKALYLVLRQRGFRVALTEFTTKPLKQKEYTKAIVAFEKKISNSGRYGDYYMLSYKGTAFQRNLHVISIFSLRGPVDPKTGKRDLLGSFELDRDQIYYAKGSRPDNGAMVYGMRSPVAVAEIVANSLEKRCHKRGFLGQFNTCFDRLHLRAP